MKKRIRSFVFAFNGIVYAFETQWNMRIHLLALIVVIFCGFLLDISKFEWIAVLLCCALVISLEMLNTAIETLADKLHPEHDKFIGIAKDASAGAVLVASIFAAVVGALVFLPHII